MTQNILGQMNKKVRGLVLSGGGGRGAYQVGVYKYLEEAGLEPEVIVGTSIGAVNGALLAMGRNARELEQIWLTLQTRDVHRLSLTALGRSLFSTAALENTVGRLVDFSKVAASPKQLMITATEVETGQLRVFKNAEITAQHIVASCSIPVVYPWTRIENRHYWDGAVLAETPLGPAIDAGAEEIYIVLLSPVGGRILPPPRNLPQSAALAFELALLSSFENDLRQLENVNQLVIGGDDAKHRVVNTTIIAPSEPVPLEWILSYKRSQTEHLIALGYADAKKVLAAH